MSSHEFLFEVDVSDEARFEGMLKELADSILLHVGYPRGAIQEIVSSVRVELGRDATRARAQRRVQFRARAGRLEIVVSDIGGREWRTNRPLPER